MKTEGTKLGAINTLVNQSLSRDPKWREFYKKRMAEVKKEPPSGENISRALAERESELLYHLGQYKKASDRIREVPETGDKLDKGWYLQLMATYLYPLDSNESMNIQLKAYWENQNLFRPEQGVTYSKLVSTGSRSSRILTWVNEKGSYNAVMLDVKRILDKVTWGTSYSSFEEGILELGLILGFLSERPEKITGVGPDNLWNIQGKMFWVIECKNQVELKRQTISKDEAGQLNNSISWFKQHYETESCAPILIHPANELNFDAFIS